MNEEKPGEGPRKKRWDEIWRHFDRLTRLSEPAREEYLAPLEEQNADLASELRSLLAHHGPPHLLLDRPGLVFQAEFEPKAPADLRRTSKIGQRIGPYHLVEELGEGGMGVVYLGERADGSVRQRVAIKLLSDTAARPATIERFRREREILARLDHPGIARLIDVGDDSSGRPYVVMEYVEGEDIDEYCDRTELGLRQRLELMVAVCAAVEAAHRHLVVHRDIKPSNVLVAADGRPKLVDFGIARRLDLHDATLGTTPALTPRWASPEQLLGEPVTPAADVYSLGLLLCHLLTGSLPYRSPGAPLPLLAREILERPPLRPSALAEGRGDESRPDARLAKRLRGDLDAIILNALNKDPDRRYRSAADLAADLRRYLGGYPIAVRSPGPLARLGKLVSRHPWASAATTVFVVSIVVLTALTGILNLRLLDSVARLEAEKANAERQRRRAVQTADILHGLFRSVAPGQTRGEDPTMRQIVDIGAARLLDESDENLDETRVELLLILAEVYTSLSDFEQATRLATLAEETSRRLGDPFLLADSRANLGRIHHQRGNYRDAADLLESALAVYERSERTRAATLAATLSDLGAARIGLEEGEAAERALRRALELSVDSENRQLVAVARLRLGSLLRKRGDLSPARDLLEEAVHELGSTIGLDHPDAMQARKELADTVRMIGDLERAIEVLEAVLADAERVYGPDHSELAPILDRLSLIHQSRGALSPAESRQRRALAIRERHFGPDSPRTTIAVNNLGWLLHDFGRFDEAEALYRRALANAEATVGPDHPSVAITLNNLGLLALDRGRPKEAPPYLERSLTVLDERFGTDHPARAFPLTNLGLAQFETGDRERGEEALAEALELRRRRLPAGHSDLRPTLTALGRVWCEMGRQAAAEGLLREALAIAQAGSGPPSFAEAATSFELGSCLLGLGQRDPGRAMIAAALPRIEERRGALDPRVLRGRALLQEATTAGSRDQPE